jgi:FkbM family methyltransferase
LNLNALLPRFYAARRQGGRNERTIQNIETIAALRNEYGIDIPYEAVLERSYRRFLKRGDVVMDVGAHTGTHAVNFLNAVGPEGNVLAFEPLPDVHLELRRGLAASHPNLRTFELALSSAPSNTASFVRAEGSLSESGLKQREYNDPKSVSPSDISVKVETIDRVVSQVGLSKLAYIKMDIEGGELDAIAGGTKTIERFRPIISVEYGGQAYGAYGHVEDSLFEVASKLRYRVFDPFMQDIGAKEVWDKAKSRYCWDYFLVPLERMDEARTWCPLPQSS